MANILIGKVAPLFKGEWKEGSSYERLDVVYHNGSSYVCIEDVSNSSTTPNANTNSWLLVAKKGDKGDVVEALNEEIVGSCTVEELDEFGYNNRAFYIGDKKPYLYSVKMSGYHVGLLTIILDSMRHTLTQVFTTNLVDINEGYNAHVDNDVFTYYRIYNISAPNADIPQGSWSEWKLKDDKNDVVEVLNEEKVGSCTIEDLDEFGYKNRDFFTGDKKPYLYSVKKNGYHIGLLTIILDELRHTLTQVFTTNLVNINEDYNTHVDNNVFTYYRIYNINAANSDTPQGSWSEWKIFNLIDLPIEKGKGENSIVINNISNNAEGANSVAEGIGTIASGEDSHAEGRNTEAKGLDSHAEGFGSRATGKYSHAEGNHTFTTNEGEHAEGSYNNSDSDTISSIGNGISGNRHNAVEVKKDGTVLIADTSASGEVYKKPMINLQDNCADVKTLKGWKENFKNQQAFKYWYANHSNNAVNVTATSVDLYTGNTGGSSTQFTLYAASNTTAGVMASYDKAKLDSVYDREEANNTFIKQTFLNEPNPNGKQNILRPQSGTGYTFTDYGAGGFFINVSGNGIKYSKGDKFVFEFDSFNQNFSFQIYLTNNANSNNIISNKEEYTVGKTKYEFELTTDVVSNAFNICIYWNGTGGGQAKTITNYRMYVAEDISLFDFVYDKKTVDEKIENVGGLKEITLSDDNNEFTITSNDTPTLFFTGGLKCDSIGDGVYEIRPDTETLTTKEELNKSLSCFPKYLTIKTNYKFDSILSTQEEINSIIDVLTNDEPAIIMLQYGDLNSSLFKLICNSYTITKNYCILIFKEESINSIINCVLDRNNSTIFSESISTNSLNVDIQNKLKELRGNEME